MTSILLDSEYVFTSDVSRLFLRVSGRRDYEETGPYLYHKCDCDEDGQPLARKAFDIVVSF